MFPVFQLKPSNQEVQHINLTKVLTVSVYVSDTILDGDGAVYVSVLFETMPDSQLFLMEDKEQAEKVVAEMVEALRDMFYTPRTPAHQRF